MNAGQVQCLKPAVLADDVSNGSHALLTFVANHGERENWLRELSTRMLQDQQLRFISHSYSIPNELFQMTLCKNLKNIMV